MKQVLRILYNRINDYDLASLARSIGTDLSLLKESDINRAHKIPQILTCTNLYSQQLIRKSRKKEITLKQAMELNPEKTIDLIIGVNEAISIFDIEI